MLHLTHVIDKATGCVFVPPATVGQPPDTIDASLQEIFYGALVHNPKMRITAAEAEKRLWRYILSLKR